MSAALTITAEDINPSKNPAFSPNLYRWVKRQEATASRLDRYSWNHTDYIGYFSDDDFIGSALNSILGSGTKATRYCYLGKRGEAILEPLWEQYLKVGRCAVDPEHQIYGADERFDITEHARVCKWCGHRQRRETYEVRETRERWVSEPSILNPKSSILSP